MVTHNTFLVFAGEAGKLVEVRLHTELLANQEQALRPAHDIRRILPAAAGAAASGARGMRQQNGSSKYHQTKCQQWTFHTWVCLLFIRFYSYSTHGMPGRGFLALASLLHSTQRRYTVLLHSVVLICGLIVYACTRW